jgi:ribosome-associated protein
MIFINSRIQIPASEFEITFVRSSGPGGQNVNKVSSKAVLRWPVVSNTSLPKDIKNRFVEKYLNRITGEGDLLITSQKYRDQSRNIDDCLEKLKQMILTVAFPPPPRRPTKPTKASKIRRSEGKRQHSTKKQQRRSVNLED